MKTVEQIVEVAEKRSTTYLGQIRIINKYYRSHDESHLFPINSRFNVTERAIRAVRKLQCTDVLEYALNIEHFISEYVNGSF